MRLFEWKDVQLLIRAERLEEIARRKLSERSGPVRDLRLSFHDGLVEITGSLKKLLKVPFKVEVRRIEIEGSDILVCIDSMSAGGIPVPGFLRTFLDREVAGGRIEIEGERRRVRIHLDRFLPESVDVTMNAVRITGEGIVLVLGPGGADPREGANEHGDRT